MAPDKPRLTFLWQTVARLVSLCFLLKTFFFLSMIERGYLCLFAGCIRCMVAVHALVNDVIITSMPKLRIVICRGLLDRNAWSAG
jgi:hypothetical protein